MEKKKKFAAKLSILSNLILTSLKFIAGIITGSMSIVSEAIHSLSDLFASIVTFFSVLKSSKPADDDHPYGHGKYEDMSGFIEGMLIIFASLCIIYEAVRKIIHNQPIETENTLGIAVMFLAVVMNFLISAYLFRVSKESNSISLYADGQHLRTDVYSSIGVLLGLIVIKLTGYYVLDSLIAIFVALFIFNTGYKIIKQTWMRLLDHSLPEEEINKIKNIVSNFSPDVTLKEQSIKTRRTGPSIDIDLILQFKENTTLCECHKICDEIEKQIQTEFVNSSISIHAEPVCYKKDCPTCKSEQQVNIK